MSSKKNKDAFKLLLGLGVFMLAVSFAAVPLYKMFCQTTGFGGTPRTSSSPSYTDGGGRDIKVIFTSSVSNNLPVKFKTLQHSRIVTLGENALAFYEAKNLSDEPITLMATYNVTPDKAGYFFHKVACFCFEKQTLMPGETMHMPVQFYVDPEIDLDEYTKNVPTITLSYTFFKYKDGMKLTNRYLK